MVHPNFENFDNCRGTVAAVAAALPSWTFWSCTCAGTLNIMLHVRSPAADSGSRGWKSGSHSRDGTTTTVLSKVLKNDVYMYHALG